MKIKTIAISTIFFLTLFASFPFLIIFISDYFAFPIYKNIILQIIGACLIILDPLIFAYVTRLFETKADGTPIFIEPTKRLVSSGLYSRTRNPIYMGHVLYSIGFILLFGRPLLIVFTIVVIIKINILVRYWEEPHLLIKFGNEYVRYCKDVPRWIKL